MNIVFVSDNTIHSAAMDQGVISASKSYYLRYSLHKVLSAIDSESSDGSGQNKLKTFWKGSAFQMPVRTFVIHWKRPEYQHEQEFGRS